MIDAPWWPETDAEVDELCRRVTAALAEVGLRIPVAFVDGFIWSTAHAMHREQIEKACSLAWSSMSRRTEDDL